MITITQNGNYLPDEFAVGKTQDAISLVEKYHYSKCVPCNSSLCCSFKRNGETIASVFFGTPVAKWSEKILELVRLVRKEEVEPKPHLTRLVGLAVKQIKRERKYDLLISFADSSKGHHGGIYQACSWNYHVQRKSACDGFLINGTFVHRRSCNAKYGTSSTKKLPDLLVLRGISCEPHFDGGKHLYWKALTKKGEQQAVRLGFKNNPYPKPAVFPLVTLP